jgi:hypothetical protein
MNAATKLETKKYMTILSLSCFMLVIGIFIGAYVGSLQQKNTAAKESEQPFVVSELKIDKASRLSNDAANSYCAQMLERQYRYPFEHFDELKNTQYETEINILEMKGVSLTRENIWCAAQVKFSTVNRNHQLVSTSGENNVWFQLTKPTWLEFKTASKEEYEAALSDSNK